MKTRNLTKFNSICHQICALIKSSNQLFDIDKRLSTYRMIAMFRLISRDMNIIKLYQKENNFINGVVSFCMDSKNMQMLELYSTRSQFQFCKKQIKHIIGRETYYLIF